MDEIITSPNNPMVKLIKSLHMKKYRDEKGLYLVEGIKMVRESLYQRDKVHMLAFSKDFPMEELDDWKDSQLIPKLCVDSNLFGQISGVKSPQGIIAILKKEKYCIDMMFQQDSGFWIILDRVQDPGNMGTIIRTVDAAGADGVVLLKGCVDPYNPKTIRATMGSVFRIPIIEVQDSMDFLTRLTKKNVDILASSIEGASIFEWKGSKAKTITALIIGNESKGISLESREFATSNVSIPIIGNAESLNASVAAGIMIYEIMRKEGKLRQGNSCICE